MKKILCVGSSPGGHKLVPVEFEVGGQWVFGDCVIVPINMECRVAERRLFDRRSLTHAQTKETMERR